MLRLGRSAIFCFLLWPGPLPPQILTNCDNIKGPATTQLAFFSQGPKGLGIPDLQLSSDPTSLRHNVRLGFLGPVITATKSRFPKPKSQGNLQLAAVAQTVAGVDVGEKGKLFRFVPFRFRSACNCNCDSQGILCLVAVNINLYCL